MKIRIDEIDDKRYTHRLVFLDLPRLMLARGLGVIHARQTRSPDKHTALKAVLRKAPAPGTVLHVADNRITLDLDDYTSKHGFNALLSLRGLTAELRDHQLTSVELRALSLIHI